MAVSRPSLALGTMRRSMAARLRTKAIPRACGAFLNGVRAGWRYGVRLSELPAVFATAVGRHLPEIGGMREAFAENRTEAQGVLRPRHEGR